MDKQEAGRMRVAMVAATMVTAAATLLGCAQAPRPPDTAASYVQPVLQLGCLLPRPEAIDTTADGSVALRVAVSARGTPTDIHASGRDTPTTAAFAEAARKCGFRPATRGGSPVDSVTRLVFSWKAGQRFIGTSRCFPPDYPDASRRQAETGTVVVLVRLPEGDGPLELQVRQTQAAPRLVAHSVDAVRSCLAHEEAREGMQRGTWYGAPYEWRLDPEIGPETEGSVR